jgi:fluoroacetyl-CoA thioesterase
MELTDNIKPGMAREETFLVQEDETARHIGSGASRVLASPWLIAFMERVSHRLIAEQLPEEFSSVGVLINVRHVAPTPVGSQVKVRADVTEVDGSRVTLNVQAWDHVELIGEGSHQRIVIDQERFLRRVDAKRPAAE